MKTYLLTYLHQVDNSVRLLYRMIVRMIVMLAVSSGKRNVMSVQLARICSPWIFYENI